MSEGGSGTWRFNSFSPLKVPAGLKMGSKEISDYFLPINPRAVGT